MTMYSFVPPFREAIFCGVRHVPLTNQGVPRVKRLRNTDLKQLC
jgi:hypothetical protein